MSKNKTMMWALLLVAFVGAAVLTFMLLDHNKSPVANATPNGAASSGGSSVILVLIPLLLSVFMLSAGRKKKLLVRDDARDG